MKTRHRPAAVGRRPASVGRATLTPGQHLRAEMQRLGLDQRSISRLVGVSRQAINNIVNDRHPISRAMAGKLGRITGHASDYWLRSEFGQTEKTSGLSRSAGTLVNHQILRAVRDGVIGVDPFQPAHLRAASLDLTLDTAGIRDRAGPTHSTGYNLKSGRSICARTRERIELPLEVIGHLGTTARAAERGIAMLHTLQIEPGFKGQLQFALFNASNRDLVLRSGEPVVTVEFVRLPESPSSISIAQAGKPPR